MIFFERVCSSATILELSKHELVISSKDGASCVSIVINHFLGFTHRVEDVVDEDGGLGEDGSGRLGSWEVANISETEDVVEFLVLKGVDVDIKPVVIKGKLTSANELRGGLRRNNVQKVKLLLNGAVLVRESGNAVVSINLLKLVHQVQVNVLAKALLKKSITVLITGREDNWSVTVVVDFSVASDIVLSESRLTEVHDLLGSTTALEWELRAGEDSLATTETFSQDRGLVGTIKSVHGADGSIVIIKSFLATFDEIVTELETRVDDEVVVSGLSAIAQGHLVLARVERSDSKLLPVDSGGLGK